MAAVSSKLATFIASLSLSEAVKVLLVAIIIVQILRFSRKLLHQYLSPLRALPGPKGSGLFGNLKEIRSVDYGVWHEQAIEKYGSVMAYKGFMGVGILFLLLDEL